MFVVVENLILDSRHVRSIVTELHAIHDAAVSAFGDHPLKIQLKVFILFLGDNVAARSFENQNAIDDFPAFADLLLLVAAKIIERLSIKENFRCVFAA